MIRSRPLEQGDRLTREEFERRYKAMPTGKRGKWIAAGLALAALGGVGFGLASAVTRARSAAHRSIDL